MSARLQPTFERYESIPFDEFDDALMHDVLGNQRLAGPVQQLLIDLHMCEAALNNPEPFGVDKGAMLYDLLDSIRKLRAACKEEWLDIR